MNDEKWLKSKDHRKPKLSFEKRVIQEVRKDGWNIQYSTIPDIDFIAVSSSAHMKKAYRVKAHGHLTHKEQDALYEFGEQTGIHVLYVHEGPGHTLDFTRVYPRDNRIR